MISTIALVWYALGWVAYGAAFSVRATGLLVFIWCMVTPLVTLFATLSIWIGDWKPAPSRQYLWRKP